MTPLFWLPNLKRNEIFSERGQIIMKWYQLMEENKEDLARLMVLENGKPMAEAMGEMGRVLFKNIRTFLWQENNINWWKFNKETQQLHIRIVFVNIMPMNVDDLKAELRPHLSLIL